MISSKVIVLVVLAVVAGAGVGATTTIIYGNRDCGRDTATAAAEKKWRENSCAGPFDPRVNPDRCFRNEPVENSPGKAF